MKRYRVLIVCLAMIVAGCSGGNANSKDRIGGLNRKKVKVEEPTLDDSFEQAMDSYRKFLEEGKDEQGQATAEAMRRLADLQLEAGSGSYDFVKQAQQKKAAQQAAAKAAGKQPVVAQRAAGNAPASEMDPAKFDIMQQSTGVDLGAGSGESQQSFEKRSTQISELTPASAGVVLPPGADQQEAVVNPSTDEAIKLYKKLLEKYPLYERNDQVMYQLARAYEEGGRQEEAKSVLDDLVKQYPQSMHYDEAQFRRGEIFFVRKQYIDSEEAYTHVVKKGVSSEFYDQALFKRGWSLFKQGEYEKGLQDFLVLLDIKTAAGYHIRTEANKTEYQRVEDTLRVVSLSFSYLGDSGYLKSFFDRNGHRNYEYLIYSNLAEHYLEKRRYQDAATTYKAFVASYPLHEKASDYDMRTIEIFRKGQFPQLVIDSKRDFAEKYALNSQYWTYHDINGFPDIVNFIKTNLQDLAKHYHAQSQRERKPEPQQAAYREAARWYRALLSSFPDDVTAPEYNFLLAELLYENKAYQEAAVEYERTAYAYPVHPKSAESGYAAVLAYREYREQSPEHMKAGIYKEMIRSSLQFADTYSEHPKAAAVLVSAAESLYELKEYERATAAAQNLIQRHKKAEPELVTAAWVVVAHSAFELKRYADAEQSYKQVLTLLPPRDERAQAASDKLAASIYKQAEEHQQRGEMDAAVEDYLRIAQAAPQSVIRETAEYDAATTLIKLEKWDQSAAVLQAFRAQHPRSELQFDVTQKLAFVYQQGAKFAEAAQEFERIALQSSDEEMSREALIEAAKLYATTGDYPSAIKVQKEYIRRFPQPVEPALEARHQLVMLYQKSGQSPARTALLKEIVDIDAHAGKQRTDRTRYLAAFAAFDLIDPSLQDFNDARLGEPFQKTLKVKKEKMAHLLKMYGDLADYEVGEMTAAATYRIAGIYYEFSRDLMASERPRNLSPEELEQYELILEEQAYPFEEKAIEVHEKNIELLSAGVFNEWIDKSIRQLGELVPARYGKQEQGEQFVSSIN
ncbi:MAG TPA: tetratricopeptide repeat protein [Gammaproteobacteria bacterium]|nr:tetratricopeptide repeat protein [Gammaproteobacteria bacterium]